MSFPEYLKGRISEDYKNLIIQKLEEIKGQTEDLKSRLAPVIAENDLTLRDALRHELDRVHELLRAELDTAEDRISKQMSQLVEEHVSSWYYSDVSQFEQQLEMLLSDILSNIPPPPKKRNEDLESLTELTGKLDQGKTQSEILNLVLQHISNWVDRAVLFVVKGEQAVGWAALGLGSDWDANRIRQINVDLNKQNILREVVQNASAAYGAPDQYSDNGDLLLQIGSTFPQTALACPIVVRGKIAGILYADLKDDVSEKPDLANLLYLASRSAGFAIDLLPLKQKMAVAPAAPAAVKTVPVSITPEPAVAPISASAATVASPVEQIQTVEEVQTAAEAEVDEFSEPTVMMPPITEPPPREVSEEDQKLHADAKRFARLLVSEIKLYNEAQVAAGREHKDLYERLRDDIERSRKMYLERVPNQIQTGTDYFYEELVRTLANGDPSLLGM